MDRSATETEAIARVLERGLAEAQRLSGLPVAFAGLVKPDQQEFSIVVLRGVDTDSLANLQVQVGEGLGGMALALQRPASVISYPEARGITRAYEHAVAPERLQSILSVPLAVPGRGPVAVLYLAERDQVGIGERIQTQLRPLTQRLAFDLQVATDVERRFAALRRDLTQVSMAERGDLRGDLVALMDATADPRTRRGLEELLGKIAPPAASAEVLVASPLTKRETEVLAEAEHGASNLQIALALGVTESTVKSYMKSAMAKLGAENRIKATRIARELGYLG
ncbi:LuxR C-terminal-related transcriptional regulator [Nocardioides dubius]|uniref:Helix-turn-helix transcriptional regulator n=1 Tax=Nocardioides dubius TaxID=317019 RepID=A0ABP4EF01_9ACTN